LRLRRASRHHRPVHAMMTITSMGTLFASNFSPSWGWTALNS
jgi:hypothetical protein